MHWFLISLLGFLVGVVVIVLIFIILYLCGVFVSTTEPICDIDDYYTYDEAVAKGMKPSDILFIENDLVFYRMVPKNNCINYSRTMLIRPPMCSFSGDIGILQPNGGYKLENGLIRGFVGSSCGPGGQPVIIDPV